VSKRNEPSEREPREPLWVKVDQAALLDLNNNDQRWPLKVLEAYAAAAAWAHLDTRQRPAPTGREMAARSGWGETRCRAVWHAALAKRREDQRGLARKSEDAGQEESGEKARQRGPARASEEGQQMGPEISPSYQYSARQREENTRIGEGSGENLDQEGLLQVWKLWRKVRACPSTRYPSPPEDWAGREAVRVYGAKRVVDRLTWAAESQDEAAKIVRASLYVGFFEGLVEAAPVLARR